MNLVLSNVLARKTALSFLAMAKVSLDGDSEMQHSWSHDPVVSPCSLSTASYINKDKHFFVHPGF